MSANDRTGVGSGSAEWQTPPELFARLNRRFKFDYDAFASHENALCDRYSTTEGTFSSLSESTADGLTFDWTDRRVFMNPPFSRGLIERCVRKAADERSRAEIIVALLPVSTTAGWWKRYVEPLCHIDWLPKRIPFVHPPFKCKEACDHALGEPLTNPPGDNIIAVFKTELMS